MLKVTKITEEEVLLTIRYDIGSLYISVSLSVITDHTLIRSKLSQYVEIKCCLSLSLEVFIILRLVFVHGFLSDLGPVHINWGQ